MDDYFKLQNKLIPELINVVLKRNNILREIKHSESIGRRNLAEKLDVAERSIRNELDFLKGLGLIEITPSGAKLTFEGDEILDQLSDYIKMIKGISDLEAKVEKILKIPKVLIVPTTHNPEYIKRDLGRFAAKELKKIILEMLGENDSITVAVTGGTTMAEVANSMPPNSKQRSITVIPGRGGLGEKVDIQANTIAAKIAEKLGGKYHLLQVLDNLPESTINSLAREPQIKMVLDLLAKANILIHGVGTAMEMAMRRGLSHEEMARIKAAGAVGEAFGFYVNENGEPVYTTTSIGLKMENLAQDNLFVVAVAEGEEKARAIRAVVRPQYHDVLITDELTANELVELYKTRI